MSCKSPSWRGLTEWKKLISIFYWINFFSLIARFVLAILSILYIVFIVYLKALFFIWNIFPFLNPLCVCLCLNQNAKRVEINHINTYIFQAFNPFQKMKTSVSKGHFPTTKYVYWADQFLKVETPLTFVYTQWSKYTTISISFVHVLGKS